VAAANAALSVADRLASEIDRRAHLQLVHLACTSSIFWLAHEQMPSTVTMQTGYKMAIKSCFYSHVIALL
jgi:dipeptide/tripeptide permease